MVGVAPHDGVNEAGKDGDASESNCRQGGRNILAICGEGRGSDYVRGHEEDETENGHAMRPNIVLAVAGGVCVGHVFDPPRTNWKLRVLRWPFWGEAVEVDFEVFLRDAFGFGFAENYGE